MMVGSTTRSKVTEVEGAIVVLGVHEEVVEMGDNDKRFTKKKR